MTKTFPKLSSSLSGHQKSPSEYCQTYNHPFSKSLDDHHTPHTLPPSSSVLDYSPVRDLPPGSIGKRPVRIYGQGSSMQTALTGSIIPFLLPVWLPPSLYIPAPPSVLLTQALQPQPQLKRLRRLEDSVVVQGSETLQCALRILSPFRFHRSKQATSQRLGAQYPSPAVLRHNTRLFLNLCLLISFFQAMAENRNKQHRRAQCNKEIPLPGNDTSTLCKEHEFRIALFAKHHKEPRSDFEAGQAEKGNRGTSGGGYRPYQATHGQHAGGGIHLGKSKRGTKR